MIVLAHCSPTTLEPYRTPNLGVLCSPRCVYGDDIQNWKWAADNDCFQGLDEKAYCRMLQRIAGRTNCLFVTVPDVVGDSIATLRLLNEWHHRVVTISGQPVALVAQDGLKPTDVPWDGIDCLFIGGTTEWKLGNHARELVDAAKARGKWVHMGRVNTGRRMTMAKSWGVDSIDGTSVSMFRDTHLPTRLNQAAQPQQLSLHLEEPAPWTTKPSPPNANSGSPNQRDNLASQGRPRNERRHECRRCPAGATCAAHPAARTTATHTHGQLASDGLV